MDLDKAHEHPAQRSWSGLDVGKLAHKPMPAHRSVTTRSLQSGGCFCLQATGATVCGG
jgi:hypothetical protein